MIPKKKSCIQLSSSLVTVHTHTKIPVPKVLAWDADPSNPVGVEYIIMEKAPGVQLYKVWGDMNDWQQLRVVTQFTELEGQMAKIRLPANGSLYLTESMGKSDTYVALDREMDPSGNYCIGPSCERRWHAPDHTATLCPQLHQGPCMYDLVPSMQ